MPTLVNQTHPYFRIYIEESGDYVSFQGGRLDIDEGDPGYETVMRVASADPFIQILVNQTTCQFCGDVFKGKNAAAQLGTHKKNIHFDLWQKEKEIEQATVISKEIKARAGFACDVCRPVQTFGAADDLAEHIKLLHIAVDDKTAAEGFGLMRQTPEAAEDGIPAATATT